MIKFFSRHRRGAAIFCCLIFVLPILQPTVVLALTSGPTQPEVQSFQSAGVSEMVDLFTGDFSYNIPLFELPGPNGGYPFNLSYQAGIGMDQEASWVGLGWNLNPGAITRQMRGLPDEFKGDLVKTKMSIKPSVTVGLGAGGSLEVFGSDAISLQVGFSVSHNNYKGVGYSIDNTLNFARAAGGGMTGGISLSLSLDSDEGVSVQPSLSLAGKIGEVGLGAGYNSKSGLSNVSFYSSRNQKLTGQGKRDENGDRQQKTADIPFEGSFSLSLAHPGYTPQISMPMNNLNLSAEFRPGGVWWGLFGHVFVRGFYNEQRLDNDKQEVPASAFGYMNYQYAGASSLLDLNREKDGMVSKESPNLAIPSLSYDIYSVAGQGISAMYRPMRNDIGIVHDRQTSSVSNGGAVGIDLAAGATHVGVNLSVNHSKSTSGPWTENNDAATNAKFQTKITNDLYEPWYFKVHGEPNVEPDSKLRGIGGDKAVRVQLSGSKSTATASAILENRSSPPLSIPASETDYRERKSRNQVIQALTNEELLNGTDEVLPHFRIDYLDTAGAEKAYLRRQDLPSHIAAFTALTPDGLRYNYGLPAYNTRHEEVTFSANGATSDGVKVSVGAEAASGDPQYSHGSIETDEFLRSISIPEYTHSHLLTSILGPDYVDLKGDGVTEDDLGYWVKFTYQKKTPEGKNYKWRDPFSMAHYQSGWLSDSRDDKGSFLYGEKELWYLAKAETKSHVSIFTTEARSDGKGVLFKLQDTDKTSSTEEGGSVFRLKEIKLYTRPSFPQTPIKTIKFEHDSSLCKKLYNQAGEGKLTLKKLWFEYGRSARGQLNPYQFTYSAKNPDYNIHNYDRWGNFKPNSPFVDNSHFPYSIQDPARKGEIDENASAWSLTQILLPSGGQIIVDYESDDYAYVQHQPAMQMMEITSPGHGAYAADKFNLTDDSLRVRFKLEKPFPLDDAPDKAAQVAEVKKYLDLKRKQIYFKIKLKLKKPSDLFEEYISGYAAINESGDMGLESANGSEFTHGYFHVAGEEANGATRHPFSLRAWQHLRTNQPDLANPGTKLKPTDKTGERVDLIKGLAGIVTEVRMMLKGFYTFCADRGWGREVKVGESWIRLKSPDKIKFGGGLRVRQITMKDRWSEDDEGVYGQVYEYTMQEEGVTISSGVAAYEPIIGADENALRYAKKYVQSVPLRSDNNLFFEYPVNETYYPGPQVGYRKVTVWSLAAAKLSPFNIAVKHTTLPNGKELFPAAASYGTTGKTEHEFFTAKDFPVITDETDKVNKPDNLSVSVPFLGSLSISKMTTSQGYSIITNDMHGKPRQISNYRQQKDGEIEPDPISWVKYNYLSESQIYDQEKVNILLNTFKESDDKTLAVATSADVANTSLPKYTLGQETEFFLDMRQFEDKAWAGGARINTDIIYLPIGFLPVPIPIPTVWPSVSKSHTQLRTAVANKVIFKTGILESTEAYDGGSRMVTRNAKWDKLTGVPALTVTNNNFDNDVFNYTVLAHRQYEGMGAAYQNVGLTLEMSSVVQDPYNKELYDFFTSLPEGTLHPGDEMILYESSPDVNTPVARVIYMGKIEGDNILFSKDALADKRYKGMITRSGFRNQLAVSAGTITALKDPSKKGEQVTHTKTITVVK
jgi:hypothetical protein